jgi:murein L,D-transpeptidase YafK
MQMRTKYLIGIILLGLISYSLIFYFKPFRPIEKNIRIEKIIVTKHKRTLDLISNDTIIKTYKVSLGKIPKGKKEFEGDKKTPEGKYIINDKSSESNYHKNLSISYPNQQDIENAKKYDKNAGGLIKIHGIRNGFGWIGRFHLLFDWTLGCIAVTNKEIDELYELIEIGTPIEIKK